MGMVLMKQISEVVLCFT